MMLDDDKCDMIFRSESFKLGNVNKLTIVHSSSKTWPFHTGINSNLATYI